ncbi:hypothetical protein C1N81_00090 (plasmid) [Streptomyces sp. SGAir0957]
MQMSEPAADRAGVSLFEGRIVPRDIAGRRPGGGMAMETVLAADFHTMPTRAPDAGRIER